MSQPAKRHECISEELVYRLSLVSNEAVKNMKEKFLTGKDCQYHKLPRIMVVDERIIQHQSAFPL